MDDARVLADTSLFIEHLRAKRKTTTTLYRLAAQARVETCAIVAAEIFYGARTAKAEEQALAVLRPFPIHPVIGGMAALQCRLLPALIKANRIPDLRDLMIAVSALDLELPLATLNRGHFEFMPGIRFAELMATP